MRRGAVYSTSAYKGNPTTFFLRRGIAVHASTFLQRSIGLQDHKNAMRMKKFIVMFAISCAITSGSLATGASLNAGLARPTFSQMNARVIYEGPAYRMISNDLIPKGGNPINVSWTTDGCFVNGKQLTPQQIKGDGYPMYINGRVKYMNYFVSYNGERYFFQV